MSQNSEERAATFGERVDVTADLQDLTHQTFSMSNVYGEKGLFPLVEALFLLQGTLSSLSSLSDSYSTISFLNKENILFLIIRLSIILLPSFASRVVSSPNH